jgi:hypothetical protein
MFQNEFRLAWGTVPVGDAWTDDPPAEDLTETTLIEEVGRIKSQVNEYDTPEAAGVIEVDGINWSISTEPTKYIYLKFQFDQTHNSSDFIHQLGLFTDTIVQAGDEDLEYVQPTSITDIGKMILLENQPVLIRNSATKEAYEFVITF